MICANLKRGIRIMKGICSRITNSLTFSVLLWYGVTLNAEIGDSLYAAGSAINEFTGDASHFLRMCSAAPLEPKHEEFAREVVEMLEVTCPVEFFQLSSHHKPVGAHCYGNHIYLSTEELDLLLQNNQDAARFLIAHELIHAVKFHVPKRIALMAGMLGFSGGLQWGFIRPLFKEEKPSLTKVLASGCCTFSTFLTAEIMLLWLYRLDEKEADCEAVRRLGKTLGLARAVAGAEAYLTSDKLFHPSSFLDQVLATHPSLEERLTAIRAVTLS